MMKKIIVGLSVIALAGFAWTASASAAGGWGGGGFSGGHSSGFSGGIHGGATFGSPHGSFGHGPSPERPRGHDWDHNGHHHHYDDGFLFLDDPYPTDDDGGYVTPADDGYWYFCPDSQSYYPQVTVCASDWEQVAPTPQ